MRPEQETMESAVKEMPIAASFIMTLIANAEDWIPPKSPTQPSPPP